MKNRLPILVLLAVILAVSSGCALETSQYDKLLSTDDVKNALANASLYLEECIIFLQYTVGVYRGIIQS